MNSPSFKVGDIPLQKSENVAKNSLATVAEAESESDTSSDSGSDTSSDSGSDASSEPDYRYLDTVPFIGIEELEANPSTKFRICAYRINTSAGDSRPFIQYVVNNGEFPETTCDIRADKDTTEVLNQCFTQIAEIIKLSESQKLKRSDDTHYNGFYKGAGAVYFFMDITRSVSWDDYANEVPGNWFTITEPVAADANALLKELPAMTVLAGYKNPVQLYGEPCLVRSEDPRFGPVFILTEKKLNDGQAPFLHFSNSIKRLNIEQRKNFSDIGAKTLDRYDEKFSDYSEIVYLANGAKTWCVKDVTSLIALHPVTQDQIDLVFDPSEKKAEPATESKSMLAKILDRLP